MASIKDMMAALDNSVSSKELPNTAETWSRLAAGDSFDELGLSPEYLKDAKKEFYENNEYDNIS